MKNIAGAIAFAWLIFGAIGGAEGARPSPNHPVRILDVVMQEDALQAFVEGMKISAREHNFAIIFTRSSPRPNNILVQAWRSDIKIISVNSTEENEEGMRFAVALYYTCNVDIPDFAFSRVAGGIRDALLSTPGVLAVDDQ
ncbi:hypothetical protein SH611_19050 [Geminicoccaceae bacterium 1502E]|nr:hypothetical protein [Geminicoccaceae bacterium 1502E]